MNATARVTLLMTPKEKRELSSRAKAAGCTGVSEYLRRKAHLPDDLDDPAVDALLDEVRASTAHANSALDDALRSMREYERRWASPKAAKRSPRVGR